eukprot:TRINITY_DN5885_c0_g1_i1.p1 TRINITY_DN5885_c0_g1~~TRINITY_DN5885_c0_g1_i1.p1  ORF type:complete len:159 (-),score=58.83 TRINITY_DN5885_c0_g1_i1:558-1034(-)
MGENKENVDAEIEVTKEELEEAFKLLDLDGDGTITIEELRKLIEKIGGNMTEAEATALIKEADKDGNNVIDYVEFTKLWSALRGEGEEEKEIRAEFRKLDSDSSGFITRDEMLAVIVNCDHFTGDKMDEAKKCVEELDVDKDGRVSYPEFLLVWKYRQ